MNPRHLANRFLDQMSTVLLVFGVALLGIGATVQVSRHVRMRGMTSAERSAPRFEDSIGAAGDDGIARRRIAPAVVEGEEGEETGGSPERLVIPSIQLDTRVTEVGWEARIVNGEKQGNVWQTADYAAGFHLNSSPPSEYGNTVLSGHNNLRGSVFKDLHEVNLGDRIYVYDTGGDRFGFEVVESFIVPEEGASEAERRDNTHWIRQTPDDRLTLVTCFPPWSNTHRAIVVAFPFDEDAAKGDDLGAIQ